MKFSTRTIATERSSAQVTFLNNCNKLEGHVFRARTSYINEFKLNICLDTDNTGSATQFSTTNIEARTPKSHEGMKH